MSSPLLLAWDALVEGDHSHALSGDGGGRLVANAAIADLGGENATITSTAITTPFPTNGTITSTITSLTTTITTIITTTITIIIATTTIITTTITAITTTIITTTTTRRA